jgi:TP901 family phage tail tape measure protein
MHRMLTWFFVKHKKSLEKVVQIALNKFGMGIVIGARDMASKVFNRVGGSFLKMTRKVERAARRQEIAMRNVAMGGAMLLAGRRAIQGLGALTDAAGKFSQGMASIGAVTKATTEEMKLLRDAAIEAGIKTQFSPDEAREGLLSLATAGQTATDATKTLIPVLDLAAGSLGQLGVGEAAEAVVGTLNAYGMEVGKAGGVTDKLLRITQLTNFQTRDFSTGLSKAAAAGATFDQSLNDVLITMGLLRNRNIDASSSATAFREVTRRVGADARSQQAVLSAGVDIFDKRTKKMRSVVDIMSDFAKKTKKMTDEERNRRVATAFGARGLIAFNAIQKASFTTMKDGTKVVLKGAEAIEALREQMDKAGGTADSFKNKLLDTFEGQKTLLRGTMETLAVVFGEPLTKILKPMVAGVVNALNAVLKFFERLPEPVKKAIMGFASFAAIITTVIGGAILLKGVMNLLGFSFTSIIITIGQMLIMGPAIILLLGGLGVAAYAAYRAFQKNSGGISDSWQDMVAKIFLGFKGLKELIFDGGLSDAMKKELDKVENEGVGRFLQGAERFLERMKIFWEGLKQGFEDGVSALADSSAMQRLIATMDDVFAIFTGKGMKDTDQALDQWGKKGESTGRRIAELGEIALNAIDKIITFGSKFLDFVSKISAEDVSKSIDDTVTTFKGLWETLKAIGEVVDVIWSVLKLVVNVIQTVGAFTAEAAAGAVGYVSAGIRTVGEVAKGDFGGRAMQEFAETPIFEETQKQVGDIVRVFDPESRIGLGEEDRRAAEKEQLQRARERRQNLGSMLAERRREGGDTDRIVEALEKVSSQIFQLSGRPPPPLKVSIDADQVNSRTKEADERDQDRDIGGGLGPWFG